RPTARLVRAAAAGTSAADERMPASQDWYRRGVADAIEREHDVAGASFRLPFLRVSLEMPRRHRPLGLERATARDVAARAGMAERAGDEGWRIGPVGLPSPRKTAYYLGLGALAAIEVVEWPIAAAIAAGTWVAQHTRPEAPAVGTGPWEHLHLPGRGHDEHAHDEHAHNGHATSRRRAASANGTHAHNGHGRRRASTDS
ncbi:hypothetical protein I7412_01040, partial [Frankia sp. CN6]